MVSYLLYMAKQGFPLTPKMVSAFAWAIAMKVGRADRFPKTGPSKNWFTRFRKRHPQLRLRKMDNLERARAEALTPEVVIGENPSRPWTIELAKTNQQH